jgi:hypothetical protein
MRAVLIRALDIAVLEGEEVVFDSSGVIVKQGGIEEQLAEPNDCSTTCKKLNKFKTVPDLGGWFVKCGTGLAPVSSVEYVLTSVGLFCASFISFVSIVFQSAASLSCSFRSVFSSATSAHRPFL